MPYKITIFPDAMKCPVASVTQEAKSVLRTMFRNLANDPHTNSRVPPSPPFVAHGRMCEGDVKGPPKAVVRVFLEIDQQRKEVGVTHISIHEIHAAVKYEGKSLGVPDDGLGVIELPST